MSLQSINIIGQNSGIQKNQKPYLFTDDAMQELYNAYCWRGEIRLREGIKLLGRYRRTFVTASIGLSGASTWSFNIYSVYVPPVTPEAMAEIEPGSVIITIAAGPNIVFTDQGNGILTSPTANNNGWINYLTGDISIITTAGAGTAATASFAYFPTLPAMGIDVREKAELNAEQTIFFDTKYAYIHDGANFQEYLPASAATWSGTDADFFWCTNYRGSDASTRLFFETNFVNASTSPMRYTDSVTWTTFQPIVAASSVTEVIGTVTTPWAVFNGSLTQFPIIEGSVVITVGALTFKDTPKDGTLVSSGSNTGTIDYTSGAIQLNFNPSLAMDTSVSATYEIASSYIFTCRVLIPYYGRLLALNVWEGADNVSATNIFNRCRFSQVGNPVQQDAWRSDVFGKGGFIDAPTNEQIVSARFYKNTLIVQFERSTWRLQYIGEYGAPFIWERISSDWGAESTFSTVLFDNGVLAVGDKAIVTSSGGDVQRIDVVIPDTVYSFRNQDSGPQRVQGIREYQKELVYWCYPDVGSLDVNQYFPNRTLVYNYRNNTFAFFRNNTTCFGSFQYPAGITWDRTDVYWDDENVTWDDSIQVNYPTVVSGNQQGFAHYFASSDAELGNDSTISANDQESLSITGVTVVPNTSVTITVKNHNIQNNEWIYVTGLNYIVDDPDNPGSKIAGSTTLNDQIYIVQYVNVDTLQLFFWNIDTQAPEKDFDVTNVGDYIGGGVLALFPSPNILTKDFNPAQAVGRNIQTSYIDFLFDSTPFGLITVEMRMNTSSAFIGNLAIGNYQVERTPGMIGYVLDASQDNPCVITSPAHGLLDGYKITIQGVRGMTNINGAGYTVTFIDVNHFSIDVDSSLFPAFTGSGYWMVTKDVYFTPQSLYAWHRFYSSCVGQFLSLRLTYNNDQMSQLVTHQQNFVLNSMQIWFRPAGRNVFGR